MTYLPKPDRYEEAPFRRTGRSGLKLPPISLGLWHNFGDTTQLETQRSILFKAFDLGITHFDLANNYGHQQEARRSTSEISSSRISPPIATS